MLAGRRALHLAHFGLQIGGVIELVNGRVLLRGMAVVVSISTEGVRMDHRHSVYHMYVAIREVGHRVGNEEEQQRRGYDMSTFGYQKTIFLPGAKLGI